MHNRRLYLRSQQMTKHSNNKCTSMHSPVISWHSSLQQQLQQQQQQQQQQQFHHPFAALILLQAPPYGLQIGSPGHKQMAAARLRTARQLLGQAFTILQVTQEI
eukprot:1154994-Pelagomonas_calceolata.AAC.4